MATVTTLFDAEGKPRAYKVRYRNSAGRPRSKTFPLGKKGLADRFAVTVEADKLTGMELDSRGERVTVDEYSRDWQALLAVREGSADRIDDALILLRAMLGNQLMRKVRQSDVRGWVKARSAQVAPSTLRADWRWVRAMFRAAVADNIIRSSPCDGVKVEAPARRQLVIPEPERVMAIAERLPPSWAFMALLGARSGLRPAELLGLCVEQIDFLRMEVLVDRQAVRGRVKLEPKTTASHRTVPLEEETVRLLAAHLGEHALGPPVTVFARQAATLLPAGEARLIFHRPDGRPVSHRSLNDTWRRQAARVGLAGCRLHDMRHFYASQLIRRGASVVLVSQLLGHSRPSITADIYAHEFADRDERARELVAAVWGARPERVLSSSDAPSS